jgi:cytochrome c peroxidase
MRQVGRAAAASPTLKNRVRLVSFSFDPERDNPARLSAYRESLRAKDLNWSFVTIAEKNELVALLAAYGQTVLRDPAGGAYSHQLRVFLIDAHGTIRNEYSTAFLQAGHVLADLESLSAETPGLDREIEATSASTPPLGAGDRRSGYESADFRTRSRALATRRGQQAELWRLPRNLPPGLPPWPKDTPLPTATQIDLGRRLFFDRRLSHNDTLACASCHLPEQGFTNQELATPVGIEGRTVRRNAPALFNLAWSEQLFHDGRERSLEHQIWAPLLAMNEMGNPSIGYVLDKIAATGDYSRRFAHVFPGVGLTLETLGTALAAYQRALVSANSAFDHARYGNAHEALSPAAARGLALFEGKAGCSGCHHLGENASLFTDHAFHNTGIGYARSMARRQPSWVWSGPGQQLPLAANAVAASSEPPPNDLGRYEITRNPEDRWKFRTPGLRNVAMTAPYMHDGSLTTLADVIDFYNRGGVPNAGLDPAIHPLGLNSEEKDALVAFLESLSGDNLDQLTLDAFSTEIGDRTADAGSERAPD